MKPSRNSSNIDGFTPSNQGRHIGFGHTVNGNGRLNAARIRRPSLHGGRAMQGSRINSPAGQPPQIRRPSAATQRTQVRQHLPGLTSYSASRSTATARDFAAQSNIHNPAHAPAGRQRGRRRGSAETANGKKGRFFGIFRRKQERQGFSWKRALKRTALVAGVFVLLAGGWLGYKAFNNGSKVFGDNNILGLLNATKLKGEDKGQVNILLAGVSTDDPGHSGAALTDSIMLVSIDTKNNQAFMLSIPRDLWVDIPNYGHAKINAANAYGDADDYSQPGYPKGGMGLLSQVVSENLEMPIHYYAKINYTAFRDAVNAVGGITVNIQSSDPRGLYDPNISPVDGGPLKLANGEQQLNGQTALNLARARGNPTPDGRYGYGYEKSDFTRTEHQRMMLLALKEKITSGGVITNPVKIGQLFDVVGKNVSTDLQPGEVRRLYDLGKQIQSDKIQSLSLNDANGVNLLASYRSPDGASALIPADGIDDYTSIVRYLKKAMTNDPIARESAKVVVLNGGDTDGLASKFSNVLTAKGLNVTAVGDAAHQEGANVIIDLSNNGKPETKKHLQQVFGNSVTTTNTTGYADADFIVILGTSQAEPAETSSDGGQ